jgi:hydrogenase maturation protein HypF
MATAHLVDAGCDCALLQGRISRARLKTIQSMMAGGVNTPRTSSMGRLFDAVAAMIGLRDTVSYEGQAAMQLEWLCEGIREDAGYPFHIDGVFAPVRGMTLEDAAADIQGVVIDTRPIIRGVADDVQASVGRQRIAERFHATLVMMIKELCASIRQATGLNKVVLSGGVFMNRLLSQTAAARLTDDGFEVFRHRFVPPNDAGLCLGQLAIATATWCARASKGDCHETGVAECPAILCEQP